MAKLGKAIGGIIGGTIGMAFGGPAGAAAGASVLGGLGHGADVASSAARESKRQSQIHGEVIRAEGARAAQQSEKLARDRERSLNKLSRGRARASARRVRGGLFGGGGEGGAQFSVAQRLGG
jgi:hypothetical protein